MPLEGEEGEIKAPFQSSGLKWAKVKTTSHLKKKFSIKRGEKSRVAKEKGRCWGGGGQQGRRKKDKQGERRKRSGEFKDASRRKELRAEH